MDREAWLAAVHGVTESNTTELHLPGEKPNNTSLKQKIKEKKFIRQSFT